MKFGLVFSFALLLSTALGCGQATSVSGQVEYNGEPVENGYLSLSASGGGKSTAAPIKNGKYQITDATPGSYVAVATGMKKIDHYTSSAEAYARANEKKGTLHTSEAADYIAPDAEGNSKTIDIQPGEQVVDLSITGDPVR